MFTPTPIIYLSDRGAATLSPFAFAHDGKSDDSGQATAKHQNPPENLKQGSLEELATNRGYNSSKVVPVIKPLELRAANQRHHQADIGRGRGHKHPGGPQHGAWSEVARVDSKHLVARSPRIPGPLFPISTRAYRWPERLLHASVRSVYWQVQDTCLRISTG